MKTVIVYSSRYGSTEKCAGALAQKLGGSADLFNLKAKKAIDLSRYDRVIIGSPVYMGKLLSEVSAFCTRNMEALQKTNLGLFICSMGAGEVAEQELAKAFAPQLLEQAKARGCFGGAINYKQMNLFHKMITNMIAKADTNFPALDADKNASFISEEGITQFARQMGR